MTRALHTGELVRIIAYNNEHADGIANTLASHGVDLNMIELFVHKTDDVWTRDDGPIFVIDRQNGNLVIEDWGFNGWVSSDIRCQFHCKISF